MIAAALPNRQATDEALLRAARAGSQEAFAALVERYGPALTRLAQRLTRDPDEARDIVQESFLRAYRRLADLDPARPFARWLSVIARNVALDELRRRRRAARSAFRYDPLALPDPGPEELAIRNAEAARIRRALARLPERYRKPLALYYVRGFRYREIALELAIPLGTVKTFISRAKRRLRDELAALEREQGALEISA
ncbi:MAG: RNA polymerase sigma factor [Vulcanimicrobiaceae bacterium]